MSGMGGTRKPPWAWLLVGAAIALVGAWLASRPASENAGVVFAVIGGLVALVGLVSIAVGGRGGGDGVG